MNPLDSLVAQARGVRPNADGSLTLCPPCSKNGCCPTIKFDESGGAVISDLGESVSFTQEQLALLELVLSRR
jgi:hypothetical protein